VTGDGATAVEVYAGALPGADPKARFGAAVTDFVFRQPAVRLGEHQAGHEAPTFMYLFTWPSSAMGGMLGSCHALELPFMWGSLDLPGISMLVGDDAPESLSHAMQDAWLAFARTGDPGHPGLPEWPAYDPDRRATMVFDATSEVHHDPEADRREFWAERI
jgi:para-nitrobenzyl esterase